MNTEYMNLVDQNRTDSLSILETETLVGWSTTCLDQTICYYLDCNTNDIDVNEDNLTNIVNS